MAYSNYTMTTTKISRKWNKQMLKLLKTSLSATYFWVLLNFQLKFNQNEGRYFRINVEEIN